MIHNPSLVKEMYEASKEEITALSDRQELSSYLLTTQLLSKAILLVCASFYEHTVTDLVKKLVASHICHNGVAEWISRIAVEGQFYKWFDFRSAKNTNPFLRQFGSDFQNTVRDLLKHSTRLQNAEKDFLELCIKRNECVHRNFAAYTLDLTLDEIYKKHRSAMTYIRVIDYGINKLLTRQ
jgi:hypothetical protein